MAAPYLIYGPPYPYPYNNYPPIPQPYIPPTNDNEEYPDDRDDQNNQESSNLRESTPIDDEQPENHSAGLPTIKIRRHTPGSSDPSLQNFPQNLETSASQPPITNVKVTINRRHVEPEQPLAQPVAYPVPFYMNPPIQQIPIRPPLPPPPVQYVQPIQVIQPVPQAKAPEKPPAVSVKTSSSQTSSDQFESELFPLPSSRNRSNNETPRRPIRTEVITPAPSILKQRRVIPKKVIYEEYDDYNEPPRLPPQPKVSEKVVSYRSVPGKTTRELENEEIAYGRRPVNLDRPDKQVVTYRRS